MKYKQLQCASITTIESVEAQTSLPLLLQRVALGEEILISDDGNPVAILVPALAKKQHNVRKTIDDLIAYSRRQERTLGAVTTRELIEESRR